MLNKIISVDRKAKESVDEAKKEKENIEKKLFEKRKSLEEEYALKAQQEIEKMREEKVHKFEISQKEELGKFEDKKKLLEEIFAQSSEKWAAEIAERAISD